MLIAKAHFPIKKSSSFDKEKYLEMIDFYLSALCINGQVWGGYKLGILNGVPEGYVTLPEKNSVSPRYHSSYGESLRSQLKSYCGSYPKWSLLTDKEDFPLNDWKKAEFLFLRTNYLDISSPLSMSYKDSHMAVPIYLLPIGDDIREVLSRWSDAYRAHDELWIGSGALELLAYEQLADIKSELSIGGRDLCKIISDSTGIPTYFYQYRYFSYVSGEKNRKCPSCGGEWRRPAIQDKNFKDFQFMCKQCCIVSHEGDSQDGDEFARIGDYNEGTNVI